MQIYYTNIFLNEIILLNNNNINNINTIVNFSTFISANNIILKVIVIDIIFNTIFNIKSTNSNLNI